MSVLETLFVVFGIVAVVWPCLVILGQYADDPDNYLILFISGVFILTWVYLT